MEKRHNKLSYQRIFSFWLPLASTWLMMSVEGPFLAAIIARLPEPKYNLAAYGVAFSLALIIEAPIIMILSAATALVKDKASFLKLRNFTYALNFIITALMLILLLPAVFYFLMQNLIGLPPEVARLTHQASLVLLPWPAAIGYRRFFQGILIRSNLTRRVAYGTVIRLSAMGMTAFFLYSFADLEGAAVGGVALSAGVVCEALASRLMAWKPVQVIRATKDPGRLPKQKLTYRTIGRFYYPLALTSILGLGVHPMVIFFVGQSRMAIESLAVLPVINSLTFIFRSLGLSYQEVGIALMGNKNENYRPLRNFAWFLGIGVVFCLGLLAFTPMSEFWFHRVSGLSLQLTDFATLPTQVMTLMPGLTVLLAFQRATLVANNTTQPVTTATLLEVLVILLVLFVGIKYLNLIGALVATLGFVIGRLSANWYLFGKLRHGVLLSTP